MLIYYDSTVEDRLVLNDFPAYGRYSMDSSILPMLRVKEDNEDRLPAYCIYDAIGVLKTIYKV